MYKLTWGFRTNPANEVVNEWVEKLSEKLHVGIKYTQHLHRVLVKPSGACCLHRKMSESRRNVQGTYCEAPLALICALYVFNLHYTDGCANFYPLFEVLFLGRKVPPKRTELATFLVQVKGMD